MTNSVSTGIIPSKEAIDLAVEKLASSAERSGCFVVAKDYRDGLYNKYFTVYTLAIALQEMSDAVKQFHNAGPGEERLGAQMRLNSFILPEPVVDPLLLEARIICATDDVNKAYQYLNGSRDDYPTTKLVLTALSRGMEIANKKEHTV